MKRSAFGKLDTRDFVRGLIVAAATAFISGAITVINNDFVLDWQTWKPVISSTTVAALSYLLLQLGTNSSGNIRKEERSKYVVKRK